MNQDDVAQPTTHLPGGLSTTDPSLATQLPSSELSNYSIQFGRLSHATRRADIARVWTACTVTRKQIRFQGWISHGETTDPELEREYACHVQNIHIAVNLAENLKTLQRALIASTRVREHPVEGTPRPDDELDKVAAGQAAAILQKLCAGAPMPDSLRSTRFAPVHPHFTTFAGSTLGMTEQESERCSLAYPENKRLINSMLGRMNKLDGKEILEREPVWVNPDGTLLSMRDASPSNLVAEAKLKAEKSYSRRQAKNSAQRLLHRKKRQTSQNEISTNNAHSADTVHSPIMSEQTSSSHTGSFQPNPTAAFVSKVLEQAPSVNLDAFDGQHRFPKQNLQKLQTHKAHRATRSGSYSQSRSPSPFPGPHRFPNSDVSQNEYTASWTEDGFAEFLLGPDSEGRTPSPRRSNGPHSPGITDGLQYQDDSAGPHRLASSTANQQASGQYLQVSDFDSQDSCTAVLLHRLADHTPNSNYPATSTNSVHESSPILHGGPSYCPPQQQTHRSSVYHNSIFNDGVAGSVPPIGLINQFGQSIPTEAMVHYAPAGRIVNNSNHTDQEMFFSEDEIISALSNTARPTPASQSFSGWKVNNLEPNNSQILLTPAEIASGHLLKDDPAFDWENQSW